MLRYSYTKIIPDVEEREAINRIVILLQKMCDADMGTSELLCFGYHVKARKQ